MEKTYRNITITVPVPNFRVLVRRNKIKLQGIGMILMALLAMKVMPEDATAAFVVLLMGVGLLVTGTKGLGGRRRKRRRKEV